MTKLRSERKKKKKDITKSKWRRSSGISVLNRGNMRGKGWKYTTQSADWLDRQELARYETGLAQQQRADHTGPRRTTKEYTFIIRTLGSHWNVTWWVCKDLPVEVWRTDGGGGGAGSECGKTRRSGATEGAREEVSGAWPTVVATRVERAGAAHSHTIRMPQELRCRKLGLTSKPMLLLTLSFIHSFNNSVTNRLLCAGPVPGAGDTATSETDSVLRGLTV